MAMLNLIPQSAGDVPYSMYMANNWVAYYLVQEQGRQKLSKKPVNPHTGEMASANDSSTWGSYQEAEAMARKLASRNYILGYGVGFEFGESGNCSGVAGIDIDNCINENDELNDIAHEILSEFQTYTELSPSGKGLHLLFKLTQSLREMRPDLFSEGSKATGKKHTALDFEIYDSGRFLTFTGKVYKGYALADKTEQVRKFLAKYFTQQSPAKKQEPQRQSQISYNRPDESDAELWAKMFSNATNGHKIRRLYEGDKTDYNNDDSSADIAMCLHLAYYTNNDARRIDSMFRQTGLYREKWERSDYREGTISKAIAMTPDYIPNVKAKQASGASPQKQEQQKPNESQQILESKPIEFSSDAEYLDTAFEADMKDFQQYSQRKTGFANLDSSLVLYPALYFIGAVSSLGKTTLCLQLADNLATMGEHVLYFAFEQTRFELVSKSLARLCQPEGAFYESAPTAIEIRKGRITPELRGAMQKFREISQHKQIIECDFTTDISRVIETVEAYIKQTGVKPCVFVDYLQLIKNDDERLRNTKDIVDANVRALKLLQMRNNLIMFVVSSLNRQNYNQVIDFESFKETGGIEYTADCVMGLQLSVMNASIFDTDTKTGEKRKVVKAAKKQKPRYLELCILKNRYGVCNESFYFKYYPQYDMFVPTTRDITQEVTKELLEKVKGKKSTK